MDSAADAAREREIETLAVIGGRPLPALRGVHPLVELAARVCAVPAAAIDLITGTHQHRVVAAGVEPGLVGRVESLSAAVLDEPAPVVVADVTVDPRFRANPWVTGELGSVRFHASAPLATTRTGTVIGRFSVFDQEPRDPAGWLADVLSLLAGRAVDMLELGLRTRQLEESTATLAAVGTRVGHDLRTPLTAILANAELLAEDSTLAENAGVRPLVEGILRAGHRLAALIDEIEAEVDRGSS